MRHLFSITLLLSAGLLALPAMAAPGDKEAKKGDSGPYAEMREKILKEFDKDGDGKLSDDEREKARDKVREFRIKMAGKKGDKPGQPGQPKASATGPHGDAKRGPGGPPHLPNPEEMFTKFDKDNDGKLSKDEFKATHRIRSRTHAKATRCRAGASQRSTICRSRARWSSQR